MFNILVVEDDAELNRLFCTVLSKNGYNPIGASDGEAALDIMQSEYIDLIITDIMMPRLDGFQLTESLRHSDRTTPVLLITAMDSFGDKQRGFLSGADDYMVKPVDVEEMLLRVGALLRRARIISDHRARLRYAYRHCGQKRNGFAAEGVLSVIQTALRPGTYLHASAAHGRDMGHGKRNGSPHGRRSHQQTARKVQRLHRFFNSHGARARVQGGKELIGLNTPLPKGSFL